MLEDAMKELTAAVKQNTAQLLLIQSDVNAKRTLGDMLRGGTAKDNKADVEPLRDKVEDDIIPEKLEAPAKTVTKKPAAKTDTVKKPASKDEDPAYTPVKAATLKLHKDKGRATAESLLAEFNCEKSAKELEPDQYEAYVKRANELLGAGNEELA